MIRHVVLLRFKEEASSPTRAAIASSFVALASEMQLVKSFEWGVPVKRLWTRDSPIVL